MAWDVQIAPKPDVDACRLGRLVGVTLGDGGRLFARAPPRPGRDGRGLPHGRHRQLRRHRRARRAPDAKAMCGRPRPKGRGCARTNPHWSPASGLEGTSERASSVKPSEAKDEATNGQFKPWPASSELNGRLRRLIASYQRENKREEARIAAQDRRNERRERIEQVIREREQQKMDSQNKKLTRKEENDFYR